MLRHCDSGAVSGKFVNTRTVTVNCCIDKRNAYRSGSSNSHYTNPAFKWLRFYFMVFILHLNPITLRPKPPPPLKILRMLVKSDIRILFSQNVLYLQISPQFQATASA